jgi:hypothetical protein
MDSKAHPPSNVSIEDPIKGVGAKNATAYDPG